MHARAGLLIVVALAAGCTRKNPFFCTDPNNANDPACHPDGSGSDGGTACTDSTQCTAAGLMVCDTSMTPSTCVQCAAADATACVDTTPVCGADDKCRGCAIDDECPSKFCDLDTGACASGDDVLYVESTGAGTTCTMAAPCKHLSDAVALLDAAHARIRMEPGAYTEVSPIDIADTVVVHGNNATLDNVSSGDIIDVRDMAVSIAVTLVDLAMTSNAGFGIQCSHGAHGVSLTLLHVEISGNPGEGVTSVGCAIVIDRGNIHENDGGGLDLSQGSFKVTNTIVATNGSAALSSVGGVSLAKVASAGNVFAFNTIVNNAAGDSSHAGIDCSQNVALALSSNIVSGNRDAGTSELAEDGGCTSSFTLSDEVLTKGTNNKMAADALLTSTFHLDTGSPAIDSADPAIANDHDIDGDHRPNNNVPDIGADEAQ